MAGVEDCRHIPRLHRVQKALPGAQECGPRRILRRDDLKAHLFQRVCDRARVVYRLAQLLVRLQIVIGVDADYQRDALGLRRLAAEREQGRECHKQ